MTMHISRREILAAAAALPLLPGTAGAQTTGTILIDGRSFTGTRTLTGTGGEGGEGLRAKSNMLIKNSSFRNLGNGAVRVASPVDNLVVEDCGIEHVYRFLEDTSSASTSPAVLSNFTLRRMVASNVDHGMTRIRYGSYNGRLEDLVAYGSADADLYCVGFQLDDQAHDIIYTRCEAHGFKETGRSSGSYWNGDGFSDERGNRAIRYLSCVATDCTDGGFDLKSAGMYLQNCLARGNKRNYRLWSSGTLSGCRSEDPKWRGGTGGAAHFSFHGDATKFVIDRPIVRASSTNTAPVFLFETTVPITIDIIGADIYAPAAPLISVKGPEPVIRWTPARDMQNVRVARERA